MKNFSKKQKLWISSLFIAALCALAVFFFTRPQEVAGVFFKVEKDGKTLYLGGSVHVAKDRYKFTKPIEKAFDESTVLATEIILSDVQSSIDDETRKSFYFPEGDNLFNHLTKENEVKVKGFIRELNLNTDEISKLKPWLAGSTISQIQYNKAGISGNKGIDMYFTNKALKDHKKLDELESAKFQFDMFGSLTYEEQEKAHITSLKSTKETVEEVNNLSEAIIKGDLEVLNESLQSMDKNDKSYTVVIKDRNINMANKIDELIKHNEKYFIVVGAAHVVGDDGLVNLLTQKGYKVERLK